MILLPSVTNALRFSSACYTRTLERSEYLSPISGAAVSQGTTVRIKSMGFPSVSDSVFLMAEETDHTSLSTDKGKQGFR